MKPTTHRSLLLAAALTAAVALPSLARADNVFQPVSQETAAQHLTDLISQVKAAKAAGRNPVVVMDIDGTLLHGVYPRTMVSTQPVAGGREYCNRLARAGAQIVYLTARSEEGDGARTLKQLKQLGVPFGRKHQLMIKPDDMDDLDFKTDAARRISRMGQMVALFDNELENIRMFQRVYPRTKVFRLGTYTHTDPAPSRGLGGMVVMKDFAPRKIPRVSFFSNLKRRWQYRPARRITNRQAKRLSRRRNIKRGWGRPVRR